MPAIVVFGGTIEGRQLAERFCDSKVTIHLCVATEYGASLLPKVDHIKIHVGRMDEAQMETFLRPLGVEHCLDLTHPYATVVTQNIIKACAACGIPYSRVLRKEGNLAGLAEGDANLVEVESVAAAAEFLNHTIGNILITTGSKELEEYTKIKEYRDRCFVRVLPSVSVLAVCKELGFEEQHMIAMQGPFSEELNYAILRQMKATWLVTKNSGKAGGYQEKCEGALRAGVQVLVIQRNSKPQEQRAAHYEVMQFSEALDFLETRYLLPEKRKVCLIGMGPGNPNYLTKEANEKLGQCDLLIGAKRLLTIWPESDQKPQYQSYCKEEILAYLEQHVEYQRIVIAYSGDIGFYSGAKGMKELLGEYEVSMIPGIASPVYLLDHLGIPWDLVKLVSHHGKSENLISHIRQQPKVCTLLGEGEPVRELCKKLIAYDMDFVRITIGERLSYEEERITSGTPQELLKQTFDKLSIALVENPSCVDRKVSFGISDETFIRGKVPMTKQEIRILSLAKLELSVDSILYDIGAGTGSISIEAGLACEQGMVYAIERNPEAVSLILENKRKFKADTVEVLEAEAPEGIEPLPSPTHVFIGGSGKKLIQIIQTVRQKNKEALFVLNAVTLETLATLEKVRRMFPEYADMEITQIQVTRGKARSGYHMMSAENPVFLVRFGGKERSIYET